MIRRLLLIPVLAGLAATMLALAVGALPRRPWRHAA
jgi:hypothetical protein